MKEYFSLASLKSFSSDSDSRGSSVLFLLGQTSPWRRGGVLLLRALTDSLRLATYALLLFMLDSLFALDSFFLVARESLLLSAAQLFGLLSPALFGLLSPALLVLDARSLLFFEAYSLRPAVTLGRRGRGTACDLMLRPRLV